jgi:hypothetical protein
VHELVQAILARGGVLESVTPRRASLEEVFVSTVATGGDRPPARSAARPPAPAALARQPVDTLEVHRR